jgi:hypothetical protein
MHTHTHTRHTHTSFDKAEVRALLQPRIARCASHVLQGTLTLCPAIDPFRNLLAPAPFDCLREKTRSISNARAPSAGATAEMWKGSMEERSTMRPTPLSARARVVGLCIRVHPRAPLA